MAEDVAQQSCLSVPFQRHLIFHESSHCVLWNNFVASDVFWGGSDIFFKRLYFLLTFFVVDVLTYKKIQQVELEYD